MNTGPGEDVQKTWLNIASGPYFTLIFRKIRKSTIAVRIAKNKNKRMCLGTKSYGTSQTIQTTNSNDSLHSAKFQQGIKVLRKEPDICYENTSIKVKL